MYCMLNFLYKPLVKQQQSLQSRQSQKSHQKPCDQYYSQQAVKNILKTIQIKHDVIACFNIIDWVYIGDVMYYRVQSLHTYYII